MRHLCYLLLVALIGCQPPATNEGKGGASAEEIKKPFIWENATVYFLLTDRFNNGNPSNDLAFERKKDGAVLRNFMGGDLKGITQKIKDGYFDRLGVNAIWFTPPVEQIRGSTDEGTGLTYAYHGYWARDWTALDPNFGTLEEMKELVETAHQNGIRIMWDAVINHTGPVTDIDPVWPTTWVREDPTCDFSGFTGTVDCSLVDNLPDVFTASQEEVEVPQFLLEKWEEEGRKEKELAELETFFKRTGFPRTPRYYFIKWLTDWIRELGIDAFRIDTAKHTEADVWDDLKKEAIAALKEWKAANPAQKPDDLDFFMTGEVYNYQLGGGKFFDYGDSLVDFYSQGFESLINFGFKYDVHRAPDSLFSMYATALNQGELAGYSVLNYLASHDDGNPYDLNREKNLEAGTLLLLTPGSAQIYYGDESARPLVVEGAQGDANLRSFMNWEDMTEPKTAEVLTHYQKLGQFRRDHVSVGAGTHEKLGDAPYTFARRYQKDGLADQVVVAMDLDANQEQVIQVAPVFEDYTKLKDYYSGEVFTVKDGQVTITPAGSLILLGEAI